MKNVIDWNKVTAVTLTALAVLFSLLIYILLGLLFNIKHAGET